MDEIHKSDARLNPGDSQDTQPGSGARTVEARPQIEESDPPPTETYDPLKKYDPKHEFHMLEEVRSNVDKGLAKITDPFVNILITFFWVAAGLVVWAASIIPLLETIRYFPLPESCLQIARWVLAIGVPTAGLAVILVWRYLILRIRLKWADVYIHKFVHAQIANDLRADKRGFCGAINGIGPDSNMALLGLLRLRLRGYHSWFRITVHPFILGFKLRKPLETNFFTPRFFVAAAPTLALGTFLGVHFGMALQKNNSANAGNGAAAGTDYVKMIGEYVSALWDTLSDMRDASQLGGLDIPISAMLGIGFVISILSYVIVYRAKLFIVKQLEEHLDTHEFLTGWSHDCSQQILRRHKLLLQFLQAVMTKIPGYMGGAGSPGLEALFNELQTSDDEDAID